MTGAKFYAMVDKKVIGKPFTVDSGVTVSVRLADIDELEVISGLKWSFN